MDERSTIILLHAVETYILTGRPAGSSQLRQRARLSFSPATIRAILHELGEAGYLHQPHTSAGRIPTDQGYRFYVDRQQDARQRSLAARRRIIAAYRRAAGRHLQQPGALAHAIAAQTRAYVIAGTAPRGAVAHTGMSYIVADFPADRLAAVREMSAFIDRADEFISRLSRAADGETKVYIGRENPFIPAVHTSLLVRTFAGRSGRTTVVTIMGPKRMPYQQHLRVLAEASHVV